VPKAVTELSESLIKDRLNVRKSLMVASGALIEGWNAINPLEFTSHE
jgi:hypothetical protein